MNPSDLNEFQNIMLGMFETFGQEASMTRLSVYKEALKPYAILDIRTALNLLIRHCKFIPKPADIIELIEQASGNKHVLSSEAWSIALSARDESNTVVWTDEMHKAWVSAKNVMDLGDEVGARRAFIESYERLVQESIFNCKPIHVTVSLGFDKAKRTQAINKAIFTGLLNESDGAKYLPHPENTFAMLENKHTEQKISGVPSALLGIKEMLKASKLNRQSKWQAEQSRLQESLKRRYEQQLSELNEEVVANG